MTVLEEVLAANAAYADEFGVKGNSPFRPRAGSRSSPAWTRASTPPSTPVSPKATRT